MESINCALLSLRSSSEFRKTNLQQIKTIQIHDDHQHHCQYKFSSSPPSRYIITTITTITIIAIIIIIANTNLVVYYPPAISTLSLDQVLTTNAPTLPSMHAPKKRETMIFVHFSRIVMFRWITFYWKTSRIITIFVSASQWENSMVSR